LVIEGKLPIKDSWSSAELESVNTVECKHIEARY